MKTQAFNHELQEIQLSYGVEKKVFDQEAIDSAEKANSYFLKLFKEGRIGFKEEFYAIPVNNANKPLGALKLSDGGIAGTVVDIRILLASLLKCLATGVIIAHNHPSGTLKPSLPDIQLTKKIKEACSFFDIKLLDHLILSPRGEFYSFMSEGEL